MLVSRLDESEAVQKSNPPTLSYWPVGTIPRALASVLGREGTQHSVRAKMKGQDDRQI